MIAANSRFVKNHLGVLAGVTVVTAYFSFGYFHIDEYFQVQELVRYKLGEIGDPLPWEAVERIRPWLQPFLYWVIARLTGVRDTYRLAFEMRLVTGLANIGALWLLLRTTLPWLADETDQRFHVRVMTLCGFFPYLFVRTSSESASSAALTAGFALLVGESSLLTSALGGLALGVAFDFRFQSAFSSLGILVWLVATRKRVAAAVAGGALGVGIGALADRWGYGAWEFPAWTYFRTNILEGAAGEFGTEPPFAYVWLSPANVFLPVVVALAVLAALAWWKAPRHALTAATLPFVVVHCLIGHKEERFLFPIAVLLVALVSVVLAPRLRVRTRWARFVTAWGFAWMAILAFVPLGWHTHVRFMRWVHDHVGDDVHAIATPEIPLNLPAFRPRVWDLQKADEAEIARRVAAGTAPKWLVSDRPILHSGTDLDRYATLVYTELPFHERTEPWVEWYDAHAFGPLRPVYFRSLYRLEYR